MLQTHKLLQRGQLHLSMLAGLNMLDMLEPHRRLALLMFCAEDVLSCGICCNMWEATASNPNAFNKVTLMQVCHVEPIKFVLAFYDASTVRQVLMCVQVALATSCAQPL